MKLWLRRHWLFVVMVAAPTLGAILYFGLIASDVYVSESRFLVRSSQHQAPSGLVGELLQSAVLGGGGHTEDDSSSVHDYVLSRDALKVLDEKFDLRKMFGNPDIDLFDRFPLFPWSRSFEKFYLYYGDHVDVESSSESSISILTVRAFTAEDAYKINHALLDMSERLVNTLNDRSRHDLIDFADHEVKLASDKAKGAAIALFTYRSGEAVFEPNKQAMVQLENVGKIQQELVTTETELAQLKKLSPENPQIGGLKDRTEALHNSIASEASKVTSNHGSFSARAPKFEELTLDVEFADKQLGIALAELESARADALQKQVYLDVLVQPNLPDKAMQPKRFRSMFTFLIFSIVGWAVASIIIASVREHAD